MITPAAKSAARQALEHFNRAHDMAADLAEAMTLPGPDWNPYRQAGDWLLKHVNGYRRLYPRCDALEALNALDRIGYTPFGIHPSGDLGFAGDEGIRPLRPSALSYELNRRKWLSRWTR